MSDPFEHEYERLIRSMRTNGWFFLIAVVIAVGSWILQRVIDRDLAEVLFVVGFVAGVSFALVHVRLLYPKLAWLVASVKPARGSYIAEYQAAGEILISRHQKRVIQIDSIKRIITFESFIFVSRFFGNKQEASVQIGFDEILGVEQPKLRRRHSTLAVRTTRGRVHIDDLFSNFELSVELLRDIAEVNGQNPDTYQKALAREPVIRTPLVAWVFIALTLIAGAVFMGWVIKIQG